MSIELAPILTSFIIVTLAELGDKTQIATIMLASRLKSFPVLIGSICGFLIVNAVCFLMGVYAHISIPYFWAKIGAAILFIIFGLLTLKSGRDENKFSLKSSSSALLTAFILVSSMELADKTNLAVLAIGLTGNSPLSAFIGIVISAFLMMSVSVAIGSRLIRTLKLKCFQMISSLSFILLGVYLLLEAIIIG